MIFLENESWENSYNDERLPVQIQGTVPDLVYVSCLFSKLFSMKMKVDGALKCHISLKPFRSYSTQN